jgi:hypothetical protein
VAKQTGLGDRLLAGGYDLSGDIASLQGIGGGPAPLDLTDITQSGYDREGGLRTGRIDFTSWFNPATDRAHERFGALPTADTIVTYCRGYGLGSPAASCSAKQVGYDPQRQADGSLSFSVSTQSNGFGIEWGIQLTPGLRSDTTATNGASIDNGAASTFGGQFYLHLTAFTGTSVVVKIQDSADNATFADLAGAAFTAATGPTAERIAISNAATVRRYLRVSTTGTFTAASFVVNGVRNETAGVVF